MLYINARIVTVSDGTIDKGFFEVADGRFLRVGDMSELSDNIPDSVDLNGLTVLPGFVDAHCHIGMWEDSLGFEGSDGNEDTDPSTPQLRAIDAINPMDKCFSEAIEAGITTVVTGPGSSNAICGQFAALKTHGVCVDDMLIKAPVSMKFALGENPKSAYHGKNQSPSTRMATSSIIREQLKRGMRYIDDINAAEKDSGAEKPELDIKCEALIPLLNREIPAHFHAHRTDDIFTAIRISKEFNLRLSIIHCTEGYLVSKRLAEEELSVMVGPIICERSKPELKGLTPACAGILDNDNILTAIISDHPAIPIQYLPLSAALAVREGMDRFRALRAITLNPAVICGIDHRVGSITPGKDADFVLFDSDPFSIEAKPVGVYINGERVK